jgi:hypothetical protein
MGRTTIRCNCGQRISQRDVMQTGYYPRMFGPSFVYVRFRCARCKKLGEQFVKQEEWESGILRDTGTESTAPERERFATLGPIRLTEQAEFHEALEKLTDLKTLNSEFEGVTGSKPPTKKPQRSPNEKEKRQG